MHQIVLNDKINEMRMSANTFIEKAPVICINGISKSP
jgi:hypothetical protein